MESSFISKKKFNVGDTVKIISESKFNYGGRCIGKTGEIANVPPEYTNKKYDCIGVKIEGMPNPNSSHSWFYFKEADLVVVNEKVYPFFIDKLQPIKKPEFLNTKLNIDNEKIFIERKPELKMEFKVGDIVKIISETKSNYHGKCIGKTGTVVIIPTEFTNIEIDYIGVKIEGMSNPSSHHSCFYFRSSDLMAVNKEVNPITKLNIKDEMHLQTDSLVFNLMQADLNYRKCKSNLRIDSIEKVMFNPPATIIFWKDGSKTVVKCRDDEEFDPEKGLAMAITKKALGNKRNYYETFWKFLPKEYKKKLKEKKNFKPCKAGYDENEILCNLCEHEDECKKG